MSGHYQTWQTNGWPQQKLPMSGFRTHTTALWPTEQSSNLFAKFDCPMRTFKSLIYNFLFDSRIKVLLEQ